MRSSKAEPRLCITSARHIIRLVSVSSQVPNKRTKKIIPRAPSKTSDKQNNTQYDHVREVVLQQNVTSKQEREREQRGRVLRRYRFRL
jgi:hypothetical protein